MTAYEDECEETREGLIMKPKKDREKAQRNKKQMDIVVMTQAMKNRR